MTLDEARALLGLAGDAEARDIRRAYLRAVKRHPPERDPEGFARVREAFELCRPRGRVSPPSPAPRPDGLETTGASTPDPAAPDDARVFDVAPAPTEPTDAEWAMLEHCYNDDLDPDERLAIVDALLARMPENADVHWARYDSLHWAGREADAKAALRSAHALGLEAFLVQLAQDDPTELSDEEFDALLTTSPLEVAWSLMSHAPAQVVEAVEHALAQRKSAQGGDETLERVVNLVLRLVATKGDALAHSLFESLCAHESRLAPREGGPGDAHWVLTNELMDLPRGLPDGLPVALAMTLLRLRANPRASIESLPLGSFARYYALDLKAKEESLRAAAPNLHAMIESCLREPHRAGPRIGPMLPLVVLLAVGSFLAINTMPRFGLMDHAPQGAVSEMDRAARDGERMALQHLFTSLCPGVGAPLCQSLGHLVLAVDGHDCAAARSALPSLESPSAHEFLDDSDRAIIAAAVEGICP